MILKVYSYNSDLQDKVTRAAYRDQPFMTSFDRRVSIGFLKTQDLHTVLESYHSKSQSTNGRTSEDVKGTAKSFLDRTYCDISKLSMQ